MHVSTKMINFAVFKILKYFNSLLWLAAAKSPAIFLLMLGFVAKFVGELKYLTMIYNDTQAKAADVALAALLAAGSAMPKDSFCAAMYKVTDDHWLHNEVLNLLEADAFIYFEGTYGWRVRLIAQLAAHSEIAVTIQLSTAQTIAIMVAIVVIMLRVFSSIYVGF